MGFQDNSGDIIFDVVLTDEGRRQLSLGDGSFNIVKFALGDDEINYSLYNASGSTALQDLNILQTPLLEAFTNNASSMKSKLISLPNQRLLYLPILRLNTVAFNNSRLHSQGNYVVCVDQNTFDNRPLGLETSIGYNTSGQVNDGIIFGMATDGAAGFIQVDAGIDSTNVSDIDESLIETEFSIEIDNRLGAITDPAASVFPSFTSIDDDHIATYILRKTPTSSFVFTPSQADLLESASPIDGPIASILRFKIRSSQDLRASNFLFDRVGSIDSTTYKDRSGATATVKIIDSIVRVTGLTTGYSLDIPVRFAKL